MKKKAMTPYGKKMAAKKAAPMVKKMAKKSGKK